MKNSESKSQKRMISSTALILVLVILTNNKNPAPMCTGFCISSSVIIGSTSSFTRSSRSKNTSVRFATTPSSSIDEQHDQLETTSNNIKSQDVLSVLEESVPMSLEEFLGTAEPGTTAFVKDDDEDIHGWFQDEISTTSNSEGMYDDSTQPAESLTNNYLRDDEDIQTEREDRLYWNNSRVVETCILVGVDDISETRRCVDGSTFTMDESMNEMRELIQTAGMKVVGEIRQRMQEPNPRTYIGTGKLIETEQLAKLCNAATIVFDAELTPGQQKSLENTLNKQLLQNDFLATDKKEQEIKILDRTALILDIFAQHAKTKEGKLQVDLALHEYRKPRLTKLWTHLERQAGSGGYVGLRGPGESQLEMDKRLIRDRITLLKKKIDAISKQRHLHRKGRTGLPILALVGYTNSGKTTLLNYLTRAGALAENMLFATLDPTTRKVKLPGYKTHPEVLLTDTVGFIQKLPTQLIAAFRATLEEVREADVLIHVMDVSNPTWKKQEASVLRVLEEIGVASNKPIVRVLNKIDLLPNAEDIKYEAAMVPSSVAVSSLTGDAMEDFVAHVEDALSEQLIPIEVEIPFSNGEELNTIHEVGNVEIIDYRSTGTYIVARVPIAIANRLKRFSVTDLSIAASSTTYESSSSANDEIDWVAIGRGRHSVKGL